MNQQRKGQWLINHIRSDKHFQDLDIDTYYKVLELTLWNMTNEQFDEIMSGYNKCEHEWDKDTSGLAGNTLFKCKKCGVEEIDD